MENEESTSINEFIKGLREHRKVENEAIENILNNPKYMNELLRRINTETYVFEKEGYNNTSFVLFKIAEKYARSNDLPPIKSNGYSIYYLKYNGCIFSVFKRINDNEINYGCYINYLNEDKLPYCISFKDIQASQTLNIDSFERGLINELNNIISRLHEEGFPLYFIQGLVDNIIDNLDTNKNNNMIR